MDQLETLGLTKEQFQNFATLTYVNFNYFFLG